MMAPDPPRYTCGQVWRGGCDEVVFPPRFDCYAHKHDFEPAAGCPPRVLNILPYYHGASVHHSVALHPNCPEPTLRRLAKADDSVQTRVASNPSCPQDVLEHLAASTTDSVRLSVAANPRASEATICQLLVDPSLRVRLLAQRHPNCPEEYRLLGQVAQ